MFKKPFEVKVNDATIEVKHEVEINSALVNQTETLVKTAEKSALRVILAGAVAVTASKVITHIVETKI